MNLSVAPQLKGMVHVPGGTFRMGSEHFCPDEAPVRSVAVDGFWIDERPVTVAQFRRFVKATGYVTVAEQVPEANDYPGADPGSLTRPARTGGTRWGLIPPWTAATCTR